MSLYNIIKKAAMGAILSGSIALTSSGLETKLHAQVEPPVIEWEKTFGGTGKDYGYGVQLTNDGGYIIVGSTSSFGAGSYDVYLIKTYPNGEKQWEKTFGGTSNDYGSSVQQTTDGGYIAAGSTKSFGAGDYDVYLIKTGPDGNLEWEKTFGNVFSDGGNSVQQTNDGGYIITGSRENGNFEWERGNINVYLIKTDLDGNKEWEKTFDKDGWDFGYSVKQTSDRGYIIAGDAGDEDSMPCPHGYLVKTDVNGDLEWEKRFRSGDCDGSSDSLQQTSDGGYIIVDTIFSQDEEGYYRPDIYLIKTGPDGNLEWEKTFDGTDYGYSVKQTSDRGYVVVGEVKGNAYLLKTDANGNLKWEKTIGGTNMDEGQSVQQTSDGGYIVAGSTESFGAGSSDIYLIKLAPEKLTPTVKHATKDNFPQRTPTATNLTFVTHGWTGNADGWVSDIASAILSNLSKNNRASDWDVWTYDWRNEADTFFPADSAINAIEQGDLVSKVLSTAGYEHLHLIGKSAGSWLIDTVSRKIENRDSKTIHLTFLDAYVVPILPLGELGKYADWAEHYVNKSDVPFTNEDLTYAHNIDITGLSTNGGSHSWPNQWYLESVHDPETPYFKEWGFAKSKEYLNSLPSHNNFPRGKTTTLEGIFLSPNEISNGDFSSNDLSNWTTEGEGAAIVTEFPPQSGNLAAQLTTGSPVSISQIIKTPDSPFILTFEHAFQSDSGTITTNIGSTTIGKLDAETSINPELSKNNYIITDPTLRNLETTINFNYVGNTGSSVILDNISIYATDSATKFIRGDSNADSSFDISDPIHTLLHLYSNIPQPSCKRALDTDDSGKIEISDAIYSLNTLFKSGPSPAEPYPSCGIDLTQNNDNLSCDFYPCQ